MKKFWKVLKIVLLVLLALIVVIGIAIAIFSVKNGKQMDACVDAILEEVSKDHEIEKKDAGDLTEITLFGPVKIKNQQYEIKGFGNMTIMTANAGVMQMVSAIFSPFDKDVALFSLDYMYMFASRTCYLEFYDLVDEKDAEYMSWMNKLETIRSKYGELEDTQASGGWYDDLITVAIYKKAGTADNEKIIDMLRDTIDIYTDMADAYPRMFGTARYQKINRVKDYSDKLIDNGGVSTDMIAGILGVDKTREFFDQVFFGTEKYR